MSISYLIGLLQEAFDKNRIYGLFKQNKIKYIHFERNPYKSTVYLLYLGKKGFLTNQL